MALEISNVSHYQENGVVISNKYVITLGHAPENSLLGIKISFEEGEELFELLCEMQHQNVLQPVQKPTTYKDENYLIFEKVSTVNSVARELFSKNGNDYIQFNKQGKYFFWKLGQAIKYVNTKIKGKKLRYRLDLGGDHVYCNQSIAEKNTTFKWIYPIIGVVKDEGANNRNFGNTWSDYADLITKLSQEYALNLYAHKGVDPEITDLISRLTTGKNRMLTITRHPAFWRTTMRKDFINNLDSLYRRGTLSARRYNNGQREMGMEYFVQGISGKFDHSANYDHQSGKSRKERDLDERTKNTLYFVQIVFSHDNDKEVTYPAHHQYFERIESIDNTKQKNKGRH